METLPQGWLEAAREPPPPAGRAGDFDFWIGEWECPWLRDDGVMEIRTAPGLDGTVRLTFRNIEADGFDWEWAASRDSGFEPLWTLRYTRVGG